MPIILCSVDQPSKYLAHYRTKGSKNGVRRWQNKDGSYTTEGYQHYAEMYGWGKRKKKNAEDERSVYIKNRISDVENSDYYKKIPEIRSEIDKIDRERFHALGDTKLSNDERWRRFEEGDRKARELLDEIRKREKELGITSAQFYYDADLNRMSDDKTLHDEVNSLLKDDQEYSSLQKSISEYSDNIVKQNKLFDKLLKDYQEKSGEEFSGDGTEAHWLLESKYPGYKKLSNKIDELLHDIIDLSESIAQNPKLQSIKKLNSYVTYFDRIVDPNTGVPWYRIGNIVPAAVVAAAGIGRDFLFIHGDEYIATYDNKGRIIPGSMRGL